MNKLCGIYQIKNIINNKKYIGSSININQRWSSHLSYLRNNKHRNYRLQQSVNKNGLNNFEFKILELCTEEKLSDIESKYIKQFQTFLKENGYNLTLDSRGFTLETRNKISKAHKGKSLSNEHIERIRLANTGRCNKYKGCKINREIVEKAILKRLKKVNQYNLRGEFLQTFSSIIEASRETNILTQNISACCKNISKKAGNYIWKFNSENLIKVEPYTHYRKK